MITVPAIRLHQFGVFLYQAILGAKDVDRLVRFEVLAYDAAAHDGRPVPKRKQKASKVNWELLEKRIAASAEAYQRPIIRKKIAELVGVNSSRRSATNRTAPGMAGRFPASEHCE